MTKRRDLVRLLVRNGFAPDDGTKHERFSHPDGREVSVPRHREIRGLTHGSSSRRRESPSE